jgi:hypothetical protein
MGANVDCSKQKPPSCRGGFVNVAGVNRGTLETGAGTVVTGRLSRGGCTVHPRAPK